MPEWLLTALQLGLGLGSIGQQQELQNEYESDIDSQIANAMGLATQVGPQTFGAYDASAQQSLGTLQNLIGSSGDANAALLGQSRSRMADILGGYRDRYNTALRELEGFGEQAKRDVDERFDQSLEQNMANLQERGLGSTTARTSGRNLNTVERSKEQRRLGEQLQGFRRSILDRLSGDTLGAQTGLSGDVLNTMRYGNDVQRQLGGALSDWYGQNAMNRANLTQTGIMAPLNTLLGINYVPPAPNPYPAMIGQNLVEPPDYSKGANSWAPWVNAGGQVAGAATLGMFL